MNLAIRLKDYRFSYTFLLITLILFSFSFRDYENPILITLIFLTLVNVTCFSSEYIVLKYNQKKKEDNKKAFLLFGYVQIIFTVLVFLFFIYVFN